MSSYLRRAAAGAVIALACSSLAAAQTSGNSTPAVAAAASGPVPLEVFAKLPAFEAPALSPNGKWMAAKIGQGGKQRLIVTPVEGPEKPMAFDPAKVDVNWWQWVNDDWLVVGVGQTIPIEGEDYYATRLVAVNARSGKTNAIDWNHSGLHADDVLWVAKDGSPNIRLSKEDELYGDASWPTVYDVDVSTGKLRKILGGVSDVYEWYADSSGQVRLGVQRFGERRVYLYRANDNAPWQHIRPKSSKQEDELPFPAIFRKDGSAIAVDDHEGRDQIYELALPTFQLGRKLFGVDGYDVDAILTNPAGDDIAGYGFTGHFPKREFLDPALKEMQQGLDQTLGEGHARIVSRSRDNKFLMVEVGSASQAGMLYYWDTNYANMQLLGYKSTDLRGRTLSPVSTINYTARDGTAMQAVLTLPRGRTAKNLPLIVMPHGGPAARDDEEWDWWAQFLAEQGYAVIQPNYRGSTGFGTAFFKLGEGQWGAKMQDDLIDAVGWAAKQGIADAHRVCIVGGSYGGYAAMQAAHRDGAHYRCAVSFAGISDLAAMRRYDRAFLLGDGAKRFWAQQAIDLAAVSPRFFAANFAMPILVVHGTEDKRVPVKQSRMLVAELRKAGKPVEYVEQVGGDHHFTRSEDRLSFLKALRAFLAKNNPA